MRKNLRLQGLETKAAEGRPPTQSTNVVLALTYPLFCPECGERRVVSDRNNGNKTNGVVEDVNSVPAVFPECTRCGFHWDRVTAPQTAMSRKLADLSDTELLAVLKLLYPSMSNLCTRVAAEVKLSTSLVLRVLQGNRRNVDVDKALVAAFRKALLERGIGQIGTTDQKVNRRTVWSSGGSTR
jgi:hypothetical protein